jgi:predicted flap endonuclease-1-like 5' DNA nuclease
MVEAVRERVDAAIDWLIERALKAGRSVIEMLRRGGEAVAAGARRVRDWWRARKSFRTDAGAEHTLYFEGSGAGARLMMRSNNPQPYRGYIESLEVPSEKQSDKEEALGIARRLDDSVRKAGSGGTREKAAGGGQGADQQESASNILTLLDDLTRVSARLFTGETAPESSTDPSYGGLTGPGFGRSVRVMRLGPDHGPGSGTENAGANATYDSLNQRRSGGSSYYIKGHLLSEKLGGPGRWQNLTPLTRTANALHETRFESKVKEAVDTRKEPVDFVVSAVYGRSNRGTTVEQLRDSGGKKDEKVADIIEVESGVPTALDCTALPLEKKGSAVASLQIPNEIETDPNSYSITDAPARSFYIGDHLTGKGGREELQKLAGIGPAEARELQKNGPYRSWAQVDAVAGVSSERIKGTTGYNVRLYRLS